MPIITIKLSDSELGTGTNREHCLTSHLSALRNIRDQGRKCEEAYTEWFSNVSRGRDMRLVPTDPLELAMLNLRKHNELTTKSIAKEAETKTMCERSSSVLEKANRDYLQSCEEAELASKEMVEYIMTQETLQKEVDQLVRERRIQQIQDKIRIQNEVSLKQVQASALRQSELEAELAVATLSD